MARRRDSETARQRDGATARQGDDGSLSLSRCPAVPLSRGPVVPPSRHLVHVVGLGDDGPEGLAGWVCELIDGAEVLVGGRRHLAFFADHPAEQVVLASDVERTLAELRDRLDGRRCVILASGDPCFFGIGPSVVEVFGRERVQIAPHVSSVALAFARLGMSWQDARVVSAHGRPLEAALRPALGARKVAFLTDPVNTPAAVARALLEAGVARGEAWVLERLDGPDERIVHASLEEIAGQEFDPLNVLVLLRPEGEARGPRFGQPERLFRSSRGQITKSEVRAVTLARLELPADGVLWDVGAGSGSVSVEAAELAPGLRIYAVERSEEQLSCLRANVAAHYAVGVEVVAGTAPRALGGLPGPHRVFVGGHGGRLLDILEVCLERLLPGGRLVANFATVEAVTMATAALAEVDWSWEVVQVQAARGREIGGQTRLEAFNPVFVVSAQRGRDE